MFGKIVLCTIAMLILPDLLQAQTDEVCSSLKGGTTGLYGMCVSYCSAKESDHSQKNRTEILAKYNKKRQPGDPPMPCLCPCFDHELVSAIAERIPESYNHFCFNGLDGDGQLYQLLQVLVSDGEPPVDPFEEWGTRTWHTISTTPEEVGCNYRDYTWDGTTSNEILEEWTGEPTPENLDLLQNCRAIMDAVWLEYDLPYSPDASCEE